jgi:glycosyltransferase involved in cell wall biosynthesis
MTPCRILVDSFADAGLTNAQMANAREIVCRLDPSLFHVSMFHVDQVDECISRRPNTILIKLGQRRQTVGILREFVTGDHHILFYLKASPASKWYLRLRDVHDDSKITLGTIESRADLRREATIPGETVRLWEQTVLRCDRLFSNSRAVKKSLEKEYGLPSEVIPTGVDTKFFVPPEARVPPIRPRILFVGSLRPFKQPQLMLDAARRYPYADFILTGDGTMAEQLHARVAAGRLQNVKLTGPLTPVQVRQQYQNADIFLFPSQWEGSPKVILEAAACGLPVIARNAYEPETVIDGVTGFTVGSDHELFLRLEQLLSSSALRQQLGAAGRRHSERFDWGIVARQWEDVFLCLTERRARGYAA